jgi:uncharacterized RDD family membrane protein YckC
MSHDHAAQHASTDSSTATPLVAPSVQRRLICMVYESMLLGAVIMAAAAIFVGATTVLNLPQIPQVLTLWLFLVIGAYFVYFWRRAGQTLAMKTWRIKLVDNELSELPLSKALVRYVLSWLWFLPGLGFASQIDTSMPNKIAIIAIAFFAWSLTAFLDPQRQFLHDRLAKTRFVSEPRISSQK